MRCQSILRTSDFSADVSSDVLAAEPPEISILFFSWLPSSAVATAVPTDGGIVVTLSVRSRFERDELPLMDLSELVEQRAVHEGAEVRLKTFFCVFGSCLWN